MDIADLNVVAAAERGAAVELRHPGTGDALGITLRVRGFESDEVESAVRDFHREAMKSKKKPEALDLVAGRRRVQAKAALIGVDGGTGGMETVEGVRKYIDAPGFVWVIEQIEAVAGDRASFFTSAATP